MARPSRDITGIDGRCALPHTPHKQHRQSRESGGFPRCGSILRCLPPLNTIPAVLPGRFQTVIREISSTCPRPDRQLLAAQHGDCERSTVGVNSGHPRFRTGTVG